MPSGPVNPTYADSLEFTLSGLDQNFEYDLYLYCQNVTNSDGADFTIGGVTKSGTGNGSTEDFIEGTTFVKFLGLSPNSSGEITGLVEVPSGDLSATFNGFQLVRVVPEPSSFVLLSIGLAGLFGCAWRRRT